MKHLVVLAALGSLMFAFGNPAEGAAKKKEAGTSILLLKVDGEQLTAEQKTAVAAEAKKSLDKYKRFEVTEDNSLDLMDAMVEHECLDMDAACLAAIGGKYKVEQVLYLKADGGKVSVVLVDVKSGKELARDERDGKDAAAVQAALAGPAMLAVFGPVPEEPKPEPKPEPEVKKVEFTIDSNVKDSKVFVNDKEVGMAPVAVKLKPGRYTFRVEREGFLAVEEKIQVADVGEKTWKANMKPVPVRKAVTAAPVPPVPGKKGEKGGEKAFYQTWWFWAAVGVGVSAVAITSVAIMSGDDSGQSYGTAKFSIDPGAAAYDGVFYKDMK